MKELEQLGIKPENFLQSVEVCIKTATQIDSIPFAKEAEDSIALLTHAFAEQFPLIYTLKIT